MTGQLLHCGCGYTDCTACAGYGWACRACGAAYFGAPPEHGMCPACAGTQNAAERPCARPAAPPLPQSALRPGKPPATRSAPPNASSRKLS